MSKLFSDPEYKAMSESDEGWLELAIEPFRFQLNEDIAQLPDRTEFGYEFVEEFIREDFDDSHYGNNIFMSTMINIIAKKTIGREFDYEEKDIVKKLFSLEMKDDVVLDMKEKTLSSSIFLVKKQDRYDDNEVNQIVASMAIKHIKLEEFKANTPRHSEIISRSNEIMDLIGAKKFRASRSIGRKGQDMRATMERILTEDEWRLRDADLVIKVCKWIASYINNSDGHALMNFTRLKCMTHKGNPIYSLEDMT